MTLETRSLLAVLLCAVFAQNSFALTLNSSQTNYTTTGDITTGGVGISSSFSGASGNLNRITNLHIITTGNNGSTSSAYGIKTSGNYNNITNNFSGIIRTTGSSGRGISLANSSITNNAGSIETQGSSSYGIYLGGDNNSAINSGNITTAQSYGIYVDGNVNAISNSGNITTQSGTSAHGIYISAASASTASDSSYNNISNSGIISAAANGIYNKDNFSHIDNSGSITSGTATSFSAIRNEGDGVVISNSGTITSSRYAIYNSGENVTINLAGNVIGALRLGNSELNILDGTIAGEIEGNDAARINIGSDSIATSFTQTSNFLNLTSLSIKEGSSFTANHTLEVSNIYLAANSNFTLASGAIFSGNIIGNGTLNLSGTNLTTNGLANSSNSLANLNIDSTSSLSSTGDIYANNILLSGEMDFSSINNSTIAGNLVVADAAKFNIGSKNQIITGNFSLNSQGILASTIENNSAGSLDISGSAIIAENAKLQLDFGNNGYIANNSNFDIIRANLASTIEEISAENIQVNGEESNVYGLLRFTTKAKDNKLILEINHLSAEEISKNSNIQNIYTSLNQIGNNSQGKLRQFQIYIDGANLSEEQLNETINQLAPSSTKASLLTTYNLVNNSLNLDEKRLEKLRLKSETKSGFFVQGFGNSIMQEQIKNDDGFSANSTGFALGFDGEISAQQNAAVSLSHARSDLKSDDSSKKNAVSSYQFNISHSKSFDDFFIDNAAAFAWHNYASRRSITALNSNATANYNGQSYLLKVRSGALKNITDHFLFIPELAMSFFHSKIDGYKERGADSLNLKVAAISANFLEARIGASVGVDGKIHDLSEFDKFRALVKISYGYNIINDRPTTISRFEGSNVSFNSPISQIDRSSLKLGLELEAFHQDEVNFTIDYSLEKRASMQSHFVIVKARQAF